ncbi:MAG: SDR family NAD(P)-dependent oxidoreductase [Oligoflexus sp.]
MIRRETLIRFEEKIVVQRSIQDCFDYLIDLINLQDWNPAVIGVKQISKGPPSLNWEYEVNLQLGFYQMPIRLRLQHIEDKKEIVIHGEHELFAIEDTLFFTHEGDMTGIRYQSEFQLKGMWEYATPLFKPMITQLNRKSIERLEKALGQAPDYQPATTLEKIADRLVIPGLAKFTRFGYQFEHRDWIPHAGFLKNKNAIITDGTSGIGVAVASAFARLGARVLIIGPDETKGILVQNQIREETGKEVIFEKANFSQVDEVINMAARVYQHFEKVDVLVNLSGEINFKRKVSDEGIEKTVATSLLGPFIFTETIHDLLNKSQDARIINVASGMIYAQKINLNDIESKEKPYQGNLAFARAKRALVDLTEIWADKWQEDHISVHSVHPGWADTSDFRTSMPGLYRLVKPLLRSPEQGADTIVWLASSPSQQIDSGQFWLDRRPHPTALITGSQSSTKEKKRLYEVLLSYWEKMTEKRTGT